MSPLGEPPDIIHSAVLELGWDLFVQVSVVQSKKNRNMIMIYKLETAQPKRITRRSNIRSTHSSWTFA